MSIFIRNEKHERSWSEIFFDFWDLAKERLETQMKMRRRLAAKRLLAALLFVIGVIYLLNALVDLIARFLNGNEWSGGLIVGALLVLIGVFIGKK